MDKKVEKAFEALKKINAPVFKNSTGTFDVSAENNDKEYWADYYGEYAGGVGCVKDDEGNVIDVYIKESPGDPYVNPKIEKIVNKYGLELEWACAGYLTAC